jgi:hypothetical protein
MTTTLEPLNPQSRATVERPTISKRDPDSHIELLAFWINGVEETVPPIDFATTDAGVSIHNNGEAWYDSGDRSEGGRALCISVSDEPDSHTTRVLLDSGLIGDWMLEEAIRVLTVIRQHRVAMRAAAKDLETGR